MNKASKRLEESVEKYGLYAIETIELGEDLGIFVKPSQERWVENSSGIIVIIDDDIPLAPHYVGGVDKMGTETLPDWEAVKNLT